MSKKLVTYLSARSKALLMAADILLFLAVLFFVYRVRFGVFHIEILSFVGTWLSLLVTTQIMYLFGCYDLDRGVSVSRNFLRIFLSAVTALAIISFCVYLFQVDPSGLFGRGVLVGTLFVFALVSGLVKAIVIRVLAKRSAVADWLFVLTSSVWQKLAKDFSGKNHFGNVLVLLDDTALGGQAGITHTGNGKLRSETPAPELVFQIPLRNEQPGILKKQNARIGIVQTDAMQTDAETPAPDPTSTHANLAPSKNVKFDSWASLPALLKEEWTGVVVTLNEKSLLDTHGQRFMDARLGGQRMMDVSSFFEAAFSKVPVFYLDPNWFIASEGFGLISNPFGIRFKRLADLFLAFILLLISWPFMLLTALLVRIESSGPALFRQTRTGKDGRLFTIYKFRSMRIDAEKDGAKWAVEHDPRVTKVGKFIRLTRLDELPQLFNVFKGDMSFIGPRPERPEFNESLEKQIPYYQLRHLVRPGITGWAQVLYPYGASVEDAVEKLQYELFYIKHYSLVLDLKIVIRTIRVVVLGRGR